MLSSEELAVISALFESNKLRHHWRGFGIETDFTLENGCLHINTHINRDMSRFIFIFLVLSIFIFGVFTLIPEGRVSLKDTLATDPASIFSAVCALLFIFFLGFFLLNLAHKEATKTASHFLEERLNIL
tara:strand:- start:1297 stop:1683 length:387 start_codon:yes stop_codon:yes gene_type:complete